MIQVSYRLTDPMACAPEQVHWDHGGASIYSLRSPRLLTLQPKATTVLDLGIEAIFEYGVIGHLMPPTHKIPAILMWASHVTPEASDLKIWVTNTSPWVKKIPKGREVARLSFGQVLDVDLVPALPASKGFAPTEGDQGPIKLRLKRLSGRCPLERPGVKRWGIMKKEQQRQAEDDLTGEARASSTLRPDLTAVEDQRPDVVPSSPRSFLSSPIWCIDSTSLPTSSPSAPSSPLPSYSAFPHDLSWDSPVFIPGQKWESDSEADSVIDVTTTQDQDGFTNNMALPDCTKCHPYLDVRTGQVR